MTNAVEKMLLNEQLLRHKIAIAPQSSYSFFFLFLHQLRDSAHRGLPTSVVRPQIFLSCTDLHHPLIFRIFTVWKVCFV